MDFLRCYICGGVMFGFIGVICYVIRLVICGNIFMGIRNVFIYYEVVEYLICR